MMRTSTRWATPGLKPLALAVTLLAGLPSARAQPAPERDGPPPVETPAPPAHPEEPAVAPVKPAPTTPAARLHAEALAHFEAKRYAQALPRFHAAAKLGDNAEAWVHLARCHARLGHAVRAARTMEHAAQRAAEQAKTTPALQTLADEAAREHVALEAAVGRLTVTLGGDAQDAQVQVDGNAWPASRHGTPVRVRPGKRLVEALRDGAVAARQEVQAVAGGSHAVQLTLAPRPAPSAALQVPRRSSQKPGAVRIAGFVVAGVGVAGLVVFAASAANAESLYDELASTCGATGGCSEEKLDQGRRLDIMSTAGLITAAVGGVAGGLMIGLGGRDQEPAAALRVGPGSLGVSGRF